MNKRHGTLGLAYPPNIKPTRLRHMGMVRPANRDLIAIQWAPGRSNHAGVITVPNATTDWHTNAWGNAGA